jgi:hypothetical protein
MATLFNRLASPPAPGVGNCPHLGIAEDPQTCLAYASEWNLCHHVRRPSAVKLEHQRASCLLETHTACPVFLCMPAAARMPARLRERRAQAGLGKWALLLLLLLISLVLVSWALWGRSGPVREPYQVPEPGVSIESLAGQFSLTTLEFAQSNALDMDCPAISGWVLVPHPARVDP